ncbi:MAG: helix-turn-helix domain-containing protein [Ancrocorticia sp.]|jgi:transcriptional regulator with XRE-family HTH domain|nr:helix-turn-helix domain-containing protein [Ancrocorticia sp.]
MLAVSAITNYYDGYIRHKEVFVDVSLEAKQLGNLLRQNRVIRNYTQEDLAFSVGVSRDTIARLENNPSSVKVENLLAVLKKFGLEKETLWAINPLSRNIPSNFKSLDRKRIQRRADLW